MCTTRKMCSDPLSHPSSTQSIAGREVAMHVQCDQSGIACPLCKSQRNYPNDCPKYDLYYQKNNGRRLSAKKNIRRRWRLDHVVFSPRVRDSQRHRACNVQEQLARSNSGNAASIQNPHQYANIVSMQHPCQPATVANV